MLCLHGRKWNVYKTVPNMNPEQNVTSQEYQKAGLSLALHTPHYPSVMLFRVSLQPLGRRSALRVSCSCMGTALLWAHAVAKAPVTAAPGEFNAIFQLPQAAVFIWTYNPTHMQNFKYEVDMCIFKLNRFPSSSNKKYSNGPETGYKDTLRKIKKT